MHENTNNPSSVSGAEGQWFGFKPVDPAKKASLVRDVFDSVAGKYDLMNDLMSAGVHRLWKNDLIDWIAPRKDQHLLDVAGGTGDISFRFLARAPEARASLCDINEAMLRVGRDRAIDKGLIRGLDYIVGDAMALPLPDRSVDVCTIAFGLRNVTEIDKALAEMRRVLKPGGRFFCLEFSKVIVPGFDKFYDWYSFNILPTVGSKVAGDREAYQYLVESIRRFPPQDELAARMSAVGFEKVEYRNLSGGIAAIHRGWRL